MSGVRGERVGDEIARWVRLRVGGHVVLLLHLLAHGVERLGGDQAALLVHLPVDLERGARIVVVEVATRGGASVHGDVAQRERGGRAPRPREGLDHAVHEVAAREIVIVVVDDVEHLSTHDDGRVVLNSESAAEAVTHSYTARGVHVVKLVSLTDFSLPAVLPVVIRLLRRRQGGDSSNVVAVEAVLRWYAGENFTASRRVQLVVFSGRLVFRTQVVVRVHVREGAHGTVVRDRFRLEGTRAVPRTDIPRRLRLRIGARERRRGIRRRPLILQRRVSDTNRHRHADRRADGDPLQGLGKLV